MFKKNRIRGAKRAIPESIDLELRSPDVLFVTVDGRVVVYSYKRRKR